MQDLATKFANLTIQSDFIFNKVMSRKRICKHLLEELLQIEFRTSSTWRQKRRLSLSTPAVASVLISS